jgi:hypothetical protein
LDSAAWIALATASIAASVALVGYFITQIANRRERKSKVYAEALAVLREYQELPYRIRRRPSSDGATRAALGDEISNVLGRLGFYRSWLEIDSHIVGDAYRDLLDQVRWFGANYRNDAWREPIISNDEEVASLEYESPMAQEMQLCLEAMRCELSLWDFRRRRSIRASLEEQREMRVQERGGG